MSWRARGWGWWFAVTAVAAGTVVRLGWVLTADIDPLSGPDSDTYHQAAIAITRLGPFSAEIPAVPYWPVGYPAFVAAAYQAFGVGSPVVGVLQALAVTVAAGAVLSMQRHFGSAALVAAVLLSVNTALIGASALLMYEPLLAGLLAGAGVLLVGRHPSRCAVAFAMVGVASVIQPKCLIAGVLWLVWAARGSSRRAIGAWAVVFLLAPMTVLVMNHSAFGAWALSANLGPTMRIGFNDEADGTYNTYSDETRRGCEQPPDLFEQDRALVACALRWAVANPTRLPYLTAMKVTTFWSPFTGPFTLRSTWGTRIDIRTEYPAYLTDNETFEAVDLVWSNIFVFGSIVLTVTGLAIQLRRNRDLAILWGIPVVAFLVVTLGTIGDARFRLPVAGFYLVAQAHALVALGRLLVRSSPTLSRFRRTALPTPREG